MKKFLKLFCVFVVLMIFTLSLTFRSEASKSSSSAVASRSLYLNNCARCHGADGKGQTELGRLNDTPDLTGGNARSMSVGRISTLISNGRGSMPSYKKKLTKAQITSLANYVRKF